MADILQTISSSSVFFSLKFCFVIQISLKLFTNGPIYIKLALFQAKAWRWTNDKQPLSETMIMKFIDAK